MSNPNKKNSRECASNSLTGSLSGLLEESDKELLSELLEESDKVLKLLDSILPVCSASVGSRDCVDQPVNDDVIFFSCITGTTNTTHHTSNNKIVG